MTAIEPERARLATRRRTCSATRSCRSAAERCAVLTVTVGLLGACIETGTLFADTTGSSATSGAAGLGGSMGFDGPAPALGGTPLGEGLPLDAGLVHPAPEETNPGASEGNCESLDGGEVLPAGCASDPSADACDACLSIACPNELETCAATPGCTEIVACARNSGCALAACYCGTINALLCASTGFGNGPCLGVTLAAPGAHAPNLVDPSAGPASQAALAVGNCRSLSLACSLACID
jgi:hypothetical protein